MSDYTCDVVLKNDTDLDISSWTIIYDEGSKGNSNAFTIDRLDAHDHLDLGPVTHTKGGHAKWTVLITFVRKPNAAVQPNYVFTKIDFGPPNENGEVTWELNTKKTGNPAELELEHEWTKYATVETAAVEAA